MTPSLSSQPIIYVSASIMFVSALLLLGRMRLRPFLQLFALQSFLLSVLAFASAKALGLPHLYISAALTFIVKVVFVPFLLSYVMAQSGASQRLQSFVKPAASLFLGVLFSLFTFWWLSTRMAAFGADTLLSVLSISTLLIGFLLLVIRQDLYSQIIAFLVMENGIFTFALSLTGGMPLLVELGIFFDVAVGAILMATLSYHVQTIHETVHTSSLQELVD